MFWYALPLPRLPLSGGKRCPVDIEVRGREEYSAFSRTITFFF